MQEALIQAKSFNICTCRTCKAQKNIRAATFGFTFVFKLLLLLFPNTVLWKSHQHVGSQEETLYIQPGFSHIVYTVTSHSFLYVWCRCPCELAPVLVVPSPVSCCLSLSCGAWRWWLSNFWWESSRDSHYLEWSEAARVWLEYPLKFVGQTMLSIHAIQFGLYLKAG